MFIPEARDIDINRWYVCLIGSDEELLKIRRKVIPDSNTGVSVFCYAVVCYYSGKELYAGGLKDCRIWLRDRLQLIRKKG